jgi:hypothetical protein
VVAPPVDTSVGRRIYEPDVDVTVLVLLCVTLVVLLLLADEEPVVADAVPLAVFVWPAPPEFAWSNALPTEFPPLFELADWSVVTLADWSTLLAAPLPELED